MLYKSYLRDVEVRRVMFLATIFGIASSFTSYALAMRWNKLLGINDLIFIILTGSVFGVLNLAMSTLPTLALFAKVTPKRIEGTIFAFLTGTTNLANTVISPMIGVWINERYAGVTADDLSNYPKLGFISMIASFLGFLIIPLIPLKADIQRYQEEREQLEL